MDSAATAPTECAPLRTAARRRVSSDVCGKQQQQQHRDILKSQNSIRRHSADFPSLLNITLPEQPGGASTTNSPGELSEELHNQNKFLDIKGLARTLSFRKSNNTIEDVAPLPATKPSPVLRNSRRHTAPDAQVGAQSEAQSPALQKKGSFSGFTFRGRSRTASLSATPSRGGTPQELKDEQNLPGLVFGVTIEQAASKAGKNGIPDVVIQCVEYIEQNGFLTSEGLYRSPGAMKRVKQWCTSFESFEGSKSTLNRQHGLRRKSREGSSESFSKRDSQSLQRAATNSFQNPPMKAPDETTNLSLVVAAGSDSEIESFVIPTIGCSNSASSNIASSELRTAADVTAVKAEKNGLWGRESIFSTAGFTATIENETSATVASLLKKYLNSVQGGFVPPGFWEPLSQIAAEESGRPPSDEIIEKVKAHIEKFCPSQSHLHTLAYVMIHLNKVQKESHVNFMTAKNLAICLFVSGHDGAEFLIQNADIIFGSTKLVPAPTDVRALARARTEHTGVISPVTALPISNSKRDSADMDTWLSELTRLSSQNTNPKLALP
ncbi:hypothetical protein HDU82_007035 [Entophlyctis luteolus]|nr:hypothetical protein HDU82_007035 [Entophlyctis luteolus]